LPLLRPLAFKSHPESSNSKETSRPQSKQQSPKPGSAAGEQTPSLSRQAGRALQTKLRQTAEMVTSLKLEIASRAGLMEQYQAKFRELREEKERYRYLYQESAGENRVRDRQKKIVTIETQKQQMKQIFITAEQCSSGISSRKHSRSGRTRLEGSSSTFHLSASITSKPSLDKSSLHLSMLLRQSRSPTRAPPNCL